MDDHLKDRRGLKRSIVTLPEYRRGKRAVNKGMRLKPEVLDPAEVKQLLGSFDTTPGGVRMCAIANLMYGGSVKMAQLVALERPNYDPRTGTLTLPATTRLTEQTRGLDLQTRQALDAWMAVRKDQRISLSAPMFCVIRGTSKGMRIGESYIRESLNRQAEKAGVDRRIHAEGLIASGKSHRRGSRSRVAAHMERYLNHESFQLRFPEAFERWEAAVDQFNAHPTRHADRVGHDCRAAMYSFINAELALHRLQPSGSLPTRLKELIKHAGPCSTGVSEHLTALGKYWDALNNLVQRQEHDGQRENETLSPEDSERLIAFTMIVMLEVDRAVPARAE